MTLEKIVRKEYVENDNTLCFKTTPVSKVVVLSILSFGIYDIILAINYWKTLKEHFGYKISPFWRGWFMLFTNFKLFPIFEKYFESYNIKFPLSVLMALLYFIFGKIMGSSSSSLIISTICFVLSTSILAFIQFKINEVNKLYYPNAPKNPWKISNIIWIIILGFLFISSCLVR